MDPRDGGPAPGPLWGLFPLGSAGGFCSSGFVFIFTILRDLERETEPCGFLSVGRTGTTVPSSRA
jgi:hypothetical protein